MQVISEPGGLFTIIANGVTYPNLSRAAADDLGRTLRGAPAPVVAPLQQPVEEEENMGWIEDIYTTVDDVAFGGALPGGSEPWFDRAIQPVTNLVTGSPTAAPVPASAPSQGATMPDGCGGTLVYKKVCGEWRWVRQRRRRRKRVATERDVKDVAAIKGVLGSGKALELWLATHPT